MSRGKNGYSRVGLKKIYERKIKQTKIYILYVLCCKQMLTNFYMKAAIKNGEKSKQKELISFKINYIKNRAIGAKFPSFWIWFRNCKPNFSQLLSPHNNFKLSCGIALKHIIIFSLVRLAFISTLFIPSRRFFTGVSGMFRRLSTWFQHFSLSKNNTQQSEGEAAAF